MTPAIQAGPPGFAHPVGPSNPAGRRNYPPGGAAPASSRSIACEAASLLMPGQSTIAGFATASILRFLGVFLLLFALETVIVARAGASLAKYRSWIVYANWATVALAIVVLAAWHAAFSALGIAAVAFVAVGVGTFAPAAGPLSASGVSGSRRYRA